MSNKITIENREINFDVLNALNLHSPMLGDAYTQFNWNPLGEDFRLDINFIERFLENARYKSESKTPAFINQDQKKVLEGFVLAAKNNKELLSDLQNRYNAGEYSKYKDADITKQVAEIIFFLKCRGQMIDIALGQIKHGDIDAFKAYENIRGINRRLSELLEEAYTEEFNKKVAIANLLDRARNLANRPELYDFEEFDITDLPSKTQNNTNEFDPINFLIEQINNLKEAFSVVELSLPNLINSINQSITPENQTLIQNGNYQNVNAKTAQDYNMTPQNTSQKTTKIEHEQTPPPPPTNTNTFNL